MFLTLWATPRSTSTAFEWMMRQRGDFECFHEPFCEAYYYGTDRRTQRDAHVADTPGLSFDSVWERLISASEQGNIFVKDHAYSMGDDFTEERLDAMTHHGFLVRDPRRVIQGISRYWPDVEFVEVGFERLHALFDRITERTGSNPPVLASDDLVDHPEEAVRAFCAAVGIPFIEESLSWEEGSRHEVSWYGKGTGPWHGNLRDSTGISKSTTVYPPLEDTPRLVELYERSLPHYETLMAHRLDVKPS